MLDGFQKSETISVITVCRNVAQTIEHTLTSVAAQNYPLIEHCVVDGASTDGTVDILKRHCGGIRWIAEPDAGIYDAMNKGIAMATGDVIGFLNADDIYAHKDVLAHVAATFEQEEIQACYADLVYVRDDLETVVRYYRSRRFAPERLAYGWMPAHPTLFLRRDVFAKYGGFKTDYKIAADFELCARLFGKYGVVAKYVPEVWVKMRMGGVSTQGIKSNILLSREIVRACRENGIKTNLFKVCLKYPRKMLELITRPS